MNIDLIDKTNLAFRRLKLVKMAIEDIEDEGQASALYEGVYLTEVILKELKELLEKARSEAITS
ncbi:hypothetical protein [Aliirhizobium cellulosilyticum]|uniref:Uncharacterized protein n=1 Tax=Aliirhizobium cellulosilyticum TaxID=393664 RepID=A0A7W6TA13_9HYPH|nr:hypothetical protein [Rhizobium cellulosilyticum]MBB4347926.1 hypothetical protein [Rhizobium cellulosilyticum]MBB4409680.1 hypothetical protein [Rhizobium cellulosilyticum]MBB4444367.1 hypothetical protein [Rhizobium cellulosilyticum]